MDTKLFFSYATIHIKQYIYLNVFVDDIITVSQGQRKRLTTKFIFLNIKVVSQNYFVLKLNYGCDLAKTTLPLKNGLYIAEYYLFFYKIYYPAYQKP